MYLYFRSTQRHFTTLFQILLKCSHAHSFLGWNYFCSQKKILLKVGYCWVHNQAQTFTLSQTPVICNLIRLIIVTLLLRGYSLSPFNLGIYKGPFQVKFSPYKQKPARDYVFDTNKSTTPWGDNVPSCLVFKKLSSQRIYSLKSKICIPCKYLRWQLYFIQAYKLQHEVLITYCWLSLDITLSKDLSGNSRFP